MSKYELMAIDMDGTLLNSNKEITPATHQTIEKALQLNKHIVLSTGRALSELKEYENELANIKYGICESGALIYDFQNKKVIHLETFTPCQLDSIFKTINQKDIMIHFFSDGNSIIAKDDLEKMPDYQMSVYQPLFKRFAKKISNHLDYAKNHHVEKINLYHKTAQDRLNTYNTLKNLPFSFAFAEATSLEISPLNATKGKGLIKLCEYLNLDLDKTIAIGDSDNDLDVLKTAKLAIAMQNANDKVKEICDIIVEDNDHEGCKEAIEKYLINES